MYCVFTSYYKHGEVGCDIIKSDKKMREYCISFLQSWDSRVDVPANLTELIEMTIAKGEEVVENQRGWGVRYVVKGENLELL